MSSEIHKYIETAIEKKSVYNAEVINFPKEKQENVSEKFKIDNFNFWRIKDKSNKDQLKAVTGICFMLAALVIMGIYSNLI